MQQYVQGKTYFATTFLQIAKYSECYTVKLRISKVFILYVSEFFPSNEIFITEEATLLTYMGFNIIRHYLVIDNELRAKFQNNSLVRHIVSSKNVKKKFLSSEPLSDDFFKILFYGI